jgi:hypothetical protein
MISSAAAFACAVASSTELKDFASNGEPAIGIVRSLEIHRAN